MPKKDKPEIRTSRAGIKDMWNASLAQGASWSVNENPRARTTATVPPNDVISYKRAKELHKVLHCSNPKYKINSFIHFYIDDNCFDGKRSGLWASPEKFFQMASHFAGIIGPDFSIYADFPKPLKEFQIYKMRLMEFACIEREIPVIVNARWGSPSTWRYTIDEFPENSMLAIGTVASRLKYLENRHAFEAGFFNLLEKKFPHTLIVVGSANYSCFKQAKEAGIQVIQFDSDTAKYFKGKKAVNYDKA